MHIREKDGMIAVYRNLDLMMATFDRPYDFIVNADYVIEANPNKPGFGKMKHDRSGLFTEEYSISVKKLLEIINFLYESEKNLYK